MVTIIGFSHFHGIFTILNHSHLCISLIFRIPWCWGRFQNRCVGSLLQQLFQGRSGGRSLQRLGDEVDVAMDLPGGRFLHKKEAFTALVSTGEVLFPLLKKVFEENESVVVIIITTILHILIHFLYKKMNKIHSS